jgi:hypothetical protein
LTASASHAANIVFTSPQVRHGLVRMVTPYWELKILELKAYRGLSAA